MMLLGDRCGDRRVWVTRDDLEQERAEVAKFRFARRSFWRGVWDGFTCLKYLFVK